MIHAICAIAHIVLLAVGSGNAGESDKAQQRIESVQTYLTTTSKSERKQVIRKLSADSLEDVATALAKAQLWENAKPGFASVQVNIASESSRKSKTLEVEVHVPKGYDSTKPYPLLIAYHGQGGSGKQFIKASLALLGEQAKEFIVAAPSDYGGMWLGASQAESEEPLAFIRNLKRLYHIDTDRIYVMGYSLGGHASFLMATFFKDSLAAAVPLSGTCAIQMGAGCLDVLLPNLKHIPILAVYGENDQSTDPATGKPTGIAVWNRYIQHAAKDLSIPITMVELPGVGHGGVIPPKDALKKILSTRRPPPPKSVSHRFRYTSQARDAWLRQTRFAGNPWTSQQLIVSPAPTETAEEAMAAMLQDKLGYIAGTIDGQSIRIETHRCDRIELLLNDNLINLGKEITITVDGTIRFQGIAKRNIKTMLDIAKDDWEFQRLYPVRFQIGRKGKAIQR